MANINLHNISKAEEELRLAHKDLIAFGKLFLPDDFERSETPFFHYEVADALQNEDLRQLAVFYPGVMERQFLPSATSCTTSVLQRNLCFMDG